MARGAVDAYLTGWAELAHAPDCSRLQWTVDVRTEPDDLRGRRGGPAHDCPTEDCGHADSYDRVTVRVVCMTCARAHVITGEEHTRSALTTRALGYGSPPRRLRGLVLWPGPPLLDEPGAEPHEYLVTRTRVARVTEADVCALIGKYRTARGATRWWAVAGPSQGRWGPVWDHRTESLRSLAAAAGWVVDHLPTAEPETGAGGETGVA